MPLLELPQPYDFEVSTERFRAFGVDRANLWHEGGLHRVVDPEVAGRQEASVQLEHALALLQDAAGSEVTGHVGDAEPVAAISDTLHEREVDEIIISTLPRRLSRWMRIDLPSKVRGLGLPVTHVEARREPAEAARDEAAA